MRKRLSLLFILLAVFLIVVVYAGYTQVQPAGSPNKNKSGTTNWTLIFQTIASFVSAVSLAGIVVAIFQLKDARKWNRMSFAFQYLCHHNPEFNKVGEELNKSFLDITDRSNPLSGDEVDKIFSDGEVSMYHKLIFYLNEIESYCTAINFGIIDNGVAKALYRYKFTRHSLELKPFIDRYRTERHAEEAWCELEKVVNKWSPKKKTQDSY